MAYEWDILRGTLRWGPSLEAVLGHPSSGEPWTLTAWERLLHPHDAPLVDVSLVEALDAGDASWRAEYRLRRGDGTYATVLDVGRILRDRNGKAVRLAGRLRDLDPRP